MKIMLYSWITIWMAFVFLICNWDGCGGVLADMDFQA